MTHYPKSFRAAPAHDVPIAASARGADDRPDAARRALIGSATAAAALATCGLWSHEVFAKGPGGGGTVTRYPLYVRTGHRDGRTGSGGTVTRYPLYVPPIESPINGFQLMADETATANFGPNAGRALAYNHTANQGYPGPTFVADADTQVSVAFTNQLASQESTVHWHGFIVPGEEDGQPTELVNAGQTRSYGFTIKQRGALNWYHPHPHMLTGEQVCLGLAGAFIVRDTVETELGMPAGAHELPLIVRDANFDKGGHLIYNPRSSGFSGNTPLVNGTRSAYQDVHRAVYRLRVLNGANARLFRLALSNGAAFWLAGNDGGLLASMVSVSEIEFGSGERLDLLVDFQGLTQGTKVMLRDLNAGWDLLEFRVGANTVNWEGPALANGTPLSTITPLAGPTTVTRLFSFDGMSRINGKEYDGGVDFTMKANTTELWRFTTSGNAPHPVHVHGASFQVVSRSGGRGRLYPWESGWKDTVLLKDNETVDVWIRFDSGFTGATQGRYVLHCHKLEHEDMGMMATFVVEP